MDSQTLDSLKMDLIVRITKLDDEVFLHHIKDEFDERNKNGLTDKQKEMLKKVAKPMRKTLDIEELKREQNWKPSSKEQIDEILKDFDWQISDEEFLKILEED